MRHLGRIAPVGNPAAGPSILSVAAVDNRERVAWFSCGQQDNIGLVNIAAPGVRTYSSVPGGFGFKSGTSMSTPHVAGIAALIFEKNPGSTPSEAWTQLASSAKPLPLPNSDVGRGLARVPDGTH
ncbi:MAG: S8 family serine peptidase, partial [Planctomycetota bacterium]|nr:S8 family serine peptidase [Planctomycetota bacterium]